MYKKIFLIALVLSAVVGLEGAEEAHLVKPEDIPPGYFNIMPAINKAEPIASDNTQVKGRANQNND